MNLNQLTVPSKDLKKSLVFYQKLGLRLLVDALPNYLRFECPEGDATLSVHLQKELPIGQGIYIYFECSSLDKEVERLQEEELVFLELPSDKPWLWREARLYDPDNNLIVLYYAGKNRKFPPWRILS